MNTKKKIINICALAYNHEAFLDDFFNGITKQQVPGFAIEVIIGVDKSSDDTLNVCKGYQSAFPHKITLLEHNARVGMMANFVEVLKACKGEYIAFCECDDYWTDKDKLYKQIMVLENDDKVILSFTDIKVLDQSTAVLKNNWAGIDRLVYTVSDLLESNIISTCTVVTKNLLDDKILKALSGFPVGDWPLYIMLLDKTNGVARYADFVGGVYREHGGGAFSSMGTVKRLTIKSIVYRKLLEVISRKSLKRKIHREQAKTMYSLGVFSENVQESCAHFFSAVGKLRFYNAKYPVLSLFKYLRVKLL